MWALRVFGVLSSSVRRGLAAPARMRAHAHDEGGADRAATYFAARGYGSVKAPMAMSSHAISPATNPRRPAPMVMMIGQRSMTFTSRVAPKITSGMEIARPMIRSAPVAARGRGHGDHVVEAHHEVGDEDGADGGPEVVARLDVRTVVLGDEELHADPQQEHGADQLEPRQREQRDRESVRTIRSTIAAPEPQKIACFCCLGGSERRGERDHHRVVARQDDVHADDLEERGPEKRDRRLSWEESVCAVDETIILSCER